MRLVIVGDDGTHLEIEENGETLRTRIQDGLTRKVAETNIPIEQVTGLVKLIRDCKYIMQEMKSDRP